MIIFSMKVWGHDMVLEYSHDAYWRSWSVFREEGGDVHLFCGKLSLVYSNLKKRRYKMGPVVTSCGLAAALLLEASTGCFTGLAQLLRGRLVL
jgi:hypothetical protein